MTWHVCEGTPPRYPEACRVGCDEYRRATPALGRSGTIASAFEASGLPLFQLALTTPIGRCLPSVPLSSVRSRVRRKCGTRQYASRALFIPSFYYQMTPKIPLNARCSISISKNLSINGRTRSSDQLGIWSYNINP